MVTRYSGTPIASTVRASRCGVVQVRRGRQVGGRTSPSEPLTTITTSAAPNAPGTAQRRASRIRTSQVSEHRCDRGRLVGQRPERLDAQHEQDAGEHRVGQRHRDAGHPVAERAHQPGEGVEEARHGERADGVGVPAVGHGGTGQQGGARGRPRHRHRQPRAPGEQQRAQPHRDGDDEQAGRRLGRVGADRGQPGEHHRERGGEPDDRRHDPRDDGLRGLAARPTRP